MIRLRKLELISEVDDLAELFWDGTELTRIWNDASYTDRDVSVRLVAGPPHDFVEVTASLVLPLDQVIEMQMDHDLVGLVYKLIELTGRKGTLVHRVENALIHSSWEVGGK